MSQELENWALIVDDEKAICDALAGVISDEGWKTKTAHSGKEAMLAIKTARPDIIFVDVWMPGMDGIETLQKIKEYAKEIPVVVMSGHGNIETAVRATKSGALNFLEKPLSLDNILPMLAQAKRIKGRNERVGTDLQEVELIGDSSSIQLIREQIKRVAPREASVLITGENGVGKEVVANMIHRASQRAQHAFVAVNCAAIPEELIESELFGHVKGAFTSAASDKKGKFEVANRGTLFLDEIGDMSLKTQSKILRVLETQEFQQVGSNTNRKVNVRVVAATNKNLQESIDKGEFREDLYYRLNVVPFEIPSLRDRLEDLPELIKFFSSFQAQAMAEGEKAFSESAMLAMRRYKWPGNVRELKNLIERLYIMVRADTIHREDLPNYVSQSVGDVDQFELDSVDDENLKEAKQSFERAFIIKKLQENNWNVSKTAEAIGLERSNLHRKMRAYKIISNDPSKENH